MGVSGNLLVQGNEDGTVKVSEYSWVYNPTCPTAGSLPARVKSGGTPSTKLSSLSRSDSSLNDVELLLLIGGCVVFLLSSCVLGTSFFYVVYWILNQNTPTKRKAEEDPGTEAGIKVQQVWFYALYYFHILEFRIILALRRNRLKRFRPQIKKGNINFTIKFRNFFLNHTSTEEDFCFSGSFLDKLRKKVGLRIMSIHPIFLEKLTGTLLLKNKTV